MNKNKLLKIASFFCKISMACLVVASVIISLTFVHFQIDRDYYQDWYIEKPIASSSIQFHTSIASDLPEANRIYLSSWNTGSLYFTFFKLIGTLFFLYLAISQFQKVLTSVRDFKTFQATNVGAFRKIGVYCLVIACITAISDWDFQNYHVSRISMNLDFLLTSLLAFIFAEIFKEGNHLMEENKLTV